MQTLSIKNFLRPGSLLFAPMEGVTDACYRNMILDLYPEWDYVSCDFLRIPSNGFYPEKHIIKHFGQELINVSAKKKKTIYQILTSDNALTSHHVQKISDLGFEWLDINLGCPSKTVCKHEGGSFLLSELKTLEKIIKVIRENFKGIFTAKIRVGYRDDANFLDILSLLESCGVDAITIHARTRDELYKGVANWDYVKQAVSHCIIPIIGNGDIWNTADIKRYYEYTNAYAIMLARSALKTPWLARLHAEGILEEDPAKRKLDIINYFNSYYSRLQKIEMPEENRVKRLKAVSRYIFDDFEDVRAIKKSFLLSKEFDQMRLTLEKI